MGKMTTNHQWIYPLVMTNSSPWYRWPIENIEIDGEQLGLAIENGGSFHGELLVITRW